MLAKTSERHSLIGGSSITTRSKPAGKVVFGPALNRCPRLKGTFEILSVRFGALDAWFLFVSLLWVTCDNLNFACG